MRRILLLLLITLISVAALWWIVRPGIFTVQLIGALPDGATIVYHSRGLEMPLFASPDSLCLKMQSSVSLLCRATALAGVTPLTERIMVRLPYIHAAYLLSTGGQEFDR
jgi:hypothetical protein